MKWNPHVPKDDYIEKDVLDALRIHESDPPCSVCKYWNPQWELVHDTPSASLVIGGVICCHAPKMFNDFSCFVWKDAPEEE